VVAAGATGRLRDGPALIAATALSVMLIENSQWRLVAPTWMMLYGVALWTAGILSVRAPRALGGVFFVAGIRDAFLGGAGGPGDGRADVRAGARGFRNLPDLAVRRLNR